MASSAAYPTARWRLHKCGRGTHMHVQNGAMRVHECLFFQRAYTHAHLLSHPSHMPHVHASVRSSLLTLPPAQRLHHRHRRTETHWRLPPVLAAAVHEGLTAGEPCRRGEGRGQGRGCPCRGAEGSGLGEGGVYEVTRSEGEGR
eukprot:366390-Chlamydomonas_euryale.AAC.35